MRTTPALFNDWHAPAAGAVGDDYLAFLQQLKGPTWITVEGRDNSRSRAIVTLLHGNEPSGLKAVHRLLREEIKPATNLVIAVVSVTTAQHPPVLSHRFLPDEEDMNRCFNPPVDSNQRRLARDLLTRLRSLQPEAVVDTHNTSGHSLPFAVTLRDDELTRQVAQLFTRRMVVIDQALGTLIEQREGHCPIVTVEFGGFSDPEADQLAHASLEEFVTREQLFDAPADPIQVLKHPLRLELREAHELHYASTVQDSADITMFNTVDQLNFARITPGTPLGWLGKGGLAALQVLSATGEDLTQTYFTGDKGFITARLPMTLFMATTDAYVAQQDCLLYLTPETN